MNIYLASSWKNEEKVKFLTKRLREMKLEVYDFTENPTPNLDKKFDLNIDALNNADLVIGITPFGNDTWAELGIVYGHETPIMILSNPNASQELEGIMWKMFTDVFDDLEKMLTEVEEINKEFDEGFMDIGNEED